MKADENPKFSGSKAVTYDAAKDMTKSPTTRPPPSKAVSGKPVTAPTPKVNARKIHSNSKKVETNAKKIAQLMGMIKNAGGLGKKTV